MGALKLEMCYNQKQNFVLFNCVIHKNRTTKNFLQKGKKFAKTTFLYIFLKFNHKTTKYTISIEYSNYYTIKTNDKVREYIVFNLLK